MSVPQAKHPHSSSFGPLSSHSSISRASYVGKGFPVCEACEEGLAANPGQGCKECEIPSWRGGRGRGGRNGGARQGCQRQGMGDEPSYGASRAGVQVPPPLPRLAPQNVPFSSRPINHCPFKHHVIPPGPPLPVLQPTQAPSRT